MRGVALSIAVLVAIMAAGCVAPDLVSDERGETFQEKAFGPGDEPITLVLHSVEGRRPTQPGVDALVEGLHSLTGKEVRLTERTMPPMPARYTVAELHAAAQSEVAALGLGGTVLHAFAVNGKLTDAGTDSGDAAGLQFGDGLFAVLMDKVLGSFGTPIVDPHVPQVNLLQYKLERAVLLHEMGHSLGLVDCGLPMVRDHVDRGHPCHSSSQRSVMWWQLHENLDAAWVMARGAEATDPVWTFDEDDLADVAAYRQSMQDE
jgi:hypothetical protein